MLCRKVTEIADAHHSRWSHRTLPFAIRRRRKRPPSSTDLRSLCLECPRGEMTRNLPWTGSEVSEQESRAGSEAWWRWWRAVRRWWEKVAVGLEPRIRTKAQAGRQGQSCWGWVRASPSAKKDRTIWRNLMTLVSGAMIAFGMTKLDDHWSFYVPSLWWSHTWWTEE